MLDYGIGEAQLGSLSKKVNLPTKSCAKAYDRSVNVLDARNEHRGVSNTTRAGVYKPHTGNPEYGRDTDSNTHTDPVARNTASRGLRDTDSNTHTDSEVAQNTAPRGSFAAKRPRSNTARGVYRSNTISVVAAAEGYEMLKSGCPFWIGYTAPKEEISVAYGRICAMTAGVTQTPSGYCDNAVYDTYGITTCPPVKAASSGNDSLHSATGTLGSTIPKEIPVLAVIGETVDAKYANQLTDLLKEYHDIFRSELPPGPSQNILHERVIPLQGDATPPYKTMYRMSPLEQKELNKQMHDFLQQKIIQPSTSPYGAPVLFVKKKDGSLRAVVNYRALNKLTVRDRFPLPRIQDLIDQLAGTAYFSSMDLTNGYYQMRLQPEDVPLTAFNTPMGHMEFLVLPMGTCNSPSAFSRIMTQLFSPHVGKFVFIYLDDVCIASKNPEEHLRHLRTVFEVFRQKGLYAKPSKCEFFKNQLKFLGHILSKDGIAVDPSKIQTLVDMPYPKDVRGMQQFLGLANYFKQHSPNHSRNAAPLYKLTKKNFPYSDEPIYRKHFEMVKESLINAPVLSYPNPDEHYDLISDASITGCGAVLVQQGKPVAYYSSKFSDPERNYTTTEQEMLGVVKALKEWRCYLEGCKSLTIITDNNPNTYFMTQPTLSRRQARWHEFMARFEFDFKHTPGKLNPADPISRIYETQRASCAVLTMSELNKTLISEFSDAYSNDDLYLIQEGVWLKRYVF